MPVQPGSTKNGPRLSPRFPQAVSINHPTSLSRPLQHPVPQPSEQHGEASEQSTRHNGEAVRVTEPQPAGSVLAGVAVAVARAVREAVEDLAGGSGRGRGRGGRRGGRVDTRGVLRTAKVLLAAVRGALIVTSARRHALVTPLGTDVVGERQGVLGNVGLLVVAADAAVREGLLGGLLAPTGPHFNDGELETYRVAGVDQWLAGRGLEADGRAAAPLVAAPRLCVACQSSLSRVMEASGLLLVAMETESGLI